MSTNRKAAGFGTFSWAVMAAAGIGLALLVSMETAHAGRLYPKMVPANLVDVEIQFQTIELNSRLYGKRELKLLQFTPLDNPNYVCQGFLQVPKSNLVLDGLMSLSSYTCFPKANGERGRAELIRGLENGWQEKQKNAQTSFGETGTVSESDEFGGWNNTRVK